MVEEDTSYIQLVIIIIGMAVSSCITVAGYLSIRKCIKKKRSKNKTEPIKTKQERQESERSGFNELVSDDNGDRIRLNTSTSNMGRTANLNELSIADHHKNMSNEQIMQEIQKHKEILNAA